MLSFATESSVDATRTTADFLHAMVTWISGSPHTSLDADRLQELQQKDEASVRSGNERVQSLVSSSTDVDLAGIRYSCRADSRQCGVQTAHRLCQRTVSRRTPSRRPSSRGRLVRDGACRCRTEQVVLRPSATRGRLRKCLRRDDRHLLARRWRAPRLLPWGRVFDTGPSGGGHQR